MQNEKIIQELKALKKPGLYYDRDARQYIDVFISPTVFEREGKIFVSAEDGRDWADYYGAYSGGYPTINKNLETFAKVRGMFWEWENPGAIYLCE